MLIAVFLVLAVVGVGALLAVVGLGISAVVRRWLPYNVDSEVLRLPGLRSLDGLSTAGIAGAVGEDAQTVLRSLRDLKGRGMVEEFGGSGLQRWRLTRFYRAAVDVPDPKTRRN